MLNLILLLVAQCPQPSNVQAVVQGGQTFITWSDPATGAAGAAYRYKLWRSTAGPIVSTTGLTPWNDRLNNSGQMLGSGTGNYSQVYRQNSTKRMANIVPDTTPLPFGTGLAVYTHITQESAYYAVTTYHVSNGCLESAPVSTSVAVSENPAPSVFVRQLKDQDILNTGLTSTVMPLWFIPHGSGSGYPANRGDLYQRWGEPGTGWQQGLDFAFAFWEDRNQGTVKPRSKILSPQDAIWTPNGLSKFYEETWHIGYYNTVPLPRVYPYTTNRYASEITWALAQPGVDTNRAYFYGKSMGGWVGAQVYLRTQGIFAAYFLHLPRFKPTNIAGTPLVPSLPVANTTSGIVATGLLMDNGQLYSDFYDSVAYAANCSNYIAPTVVGIGTADQYSSWAQVKNFITNMQTCKRWVAIRWSAGNHTTDLSLAPNSPLMNEYQQVFRKNVSHPAFSNSSLDNNINVDAAGCINCGWTWIVTSDTLVSWSATITNSNNTTGMSVEVTPRNTQAFTLSPGELVNWVCAECGSSGVVFASANGYVTIPLSVPANTTFTLTLSK